MLMDAGWGFLHCGALLTLLATRTMCNACLAAQCTSQVHSCQLPIQAAEFLLLLLSPAACGCITSAGRALPYTESRALSIWQLAALLQISLLFGRHKLHYYPAAGALQQSNLHSFKCGSLHKALGKGTLRRSLVAACSTAWCCLVPNPRTPTNRCYWPPTLTSQ